MAQAANELVIQPDKYARDARAWHDWAEGNYMASVMLFESQNPFVWFAAATLGHHALEMYLKAALIREGMTVFDPKKIRHMDPAATSLRESDCVWGHSLLELARALSKKRPEFDLKAEMSLGGCVVLRMPMTVEEGFAHFDPFFSELRYPQELKSVMGLGQEDKHVLDELVARLKPFMEPVGTTCL